MAGCTGDLGGVQVVWVDTKQKPFDLLDTIIHESVHVYQHFLAHIGETSVGKESQAYGIAYIASTLLTELERQNAIHEDREREVSQGLQKREPDVQLEAGANQSTVGTDSDTETS